MYKTEKVTPDQLLELIRELPDSESHISICPIDGSHTVTAEWLGIGDAFDATSYEEAAQMQIDFLNEYKSNPNVIGRSIVKSGWPDLEKVKEHCLQNIA